MPWVRFSEVFRWQPPERRGRTTIRYSAGVYLVRKPCADAAVKAGKGQLTTKPKDAPQ